MHMVHARHNASVNATDKLAVVAVMFYEVSTANSATDVMNVIVDRLVNVTRAGTDFLSPSKRVQRKQ